MRNATQYNVNVIFEMYVRSMAKSRRILQSDAITVLLQRERRDKILKRGNAQVLLQRERRDKILKRGRVH